MGRRRRLLCVALALAGGAGTAACRIQPIHDADVVANAAVVSVIARTGRRGGAGTGFAIAPTRIVTARHVIEGHSDLYVRLADGRQVAAKFVVAESEAHDLAILEIEPTPGLAPLAWSTKTPDEGDVHRCVSSVGAKAQTLTRVVCAGTEEMHPYFGVVIPWRGELGPGASGAPILDAHGDVVAVFVGGSSTPGDPFHAVPTRLAAALKEERRWSQVEWAVRTKAEPAAAARAVHDRAGRAYLDQKYEEALRILEDGFPALAPLPRYAQEGLVRIVSCLGMLRREGEIEARLRKAAREYPDRAWSRRILAAWLLQSERNEEALEETRAVLRCDPNDPDAHSYIVRILLDLQRFPEAEAQARVDVSLHPASFASHHYLGLALVRLRRVEAAEPEFAVALRLQPSSSEARIMHVWTLLTLGRMQEGSAEIEELIHRDPRHIEARVMAVQVAHKLGDEEGYARAIEALRTLDAARAKELDDERKRSAAGSPR